MTPIAKSKKHPFFSLKLKKWGSIELDWPLQPERRWTSEIKNFSHIPNAKLQSKVDYYITPYNKTIQVDKHMEFGEKSSNFRKESLEEFSENKWGKLMNFITKAERNVFRHSLHSINNGLYLELHNMIKNEVKKRMKSVVIQKIWSQMNHTPKITNLIPKLLSNESEGIFWLKSFLNMSQKKQKVWK